MSLILNANWNYPPAVGFPSAQKFHASTMSTPSTKSITVSNQFAPIREIRVKVLYVTRCQLRWRSVLPNGSRSFSSNAAPVTSWTPVKSA